MNLFDYFCHLRIVYKINKTMNIAHNHSMTATKICCPQHIFKISAALKQQNRLNERCVILKKYVETHTSGQIMISMKDNSELKQKFLKICNDEICQYLILSTFT